MESEIKHVEKQIQNPSSPLAATSPQSTASSRVDNSQSSTTTSKPRVDNVPGFKVDYDSMSGPSHKVKQPNAHRQSPGARSTASPPEGRKASVGAVLVEGEWRFVFYATLKIVILFLYKEKSNITCSLFDSDILHVFDGCLLMYLLC